MNANDELRAMLDEHGVNWDYGITGAATTKFRANGVDLTFMSMRDGIVCTTILTPAQVISATVGSRRAEDVIRQLIARLGDAADFHFARKYVDCIVEEYATKLATLGAGTCHNVHEPPKDETFWPAPHFKCSECGATHVSMEYVFYCPNCGRKVVDE